MVPTRGGFESRAAASVGADRCEASRPRITPLSENVMGLRHPQITALELSDAMFKALQALCSFRGVGGGWDTMRMVVLEIVWARGVRGWGRE